jgi:hypothetical protein
LRERRRGQIRRRVRAQVFFRDTAEEPAQELACQAAPRSGQAARNAADYLLDEGETGCGNLAEHSITPVRREKRAIIPALIVSPGVCRAHLDRAT